MRHFWEIVKSKRFSLLLKKVMIVMLVCMMALFFYKSVISIFLTVLLVIIASISKLYKRVIHSIGFELVTFASIIFFFTHGPLVGFLLSLFMLIASTLISSRITNILVFQAMIYGIMAVLSLFLAPLGIITAAKVLVVFYNILLHFIGIFVIHYPPHNSVLHFIVNVVTTFFIIDWTALWLVAHI